MVVPSGFIPPSGCEENLVREPSPSERVHGNMGGSSRRLDITICVSNMRVSVLEGTPFVCFEGKLPPFFCGELQKMGRAPRIGRAGAAARSWTWALTEAEIDAVLKLLVPVGRSRNPMV